MSVGAVYAAYLVACVGLAALAWKRPALAVAAIIVLDPFDLARHIGPTTITVSKAALIGLALGLLLRRARARRLMRREITWTGLALLALAGATALSITQAHLPIPAIRETFKALEYLATFLLCALAYMEEPRPAAIVAGIGIITAVVSLLALAQVFHGAPSALLIGGHVVPRIAGPLDGPNQLAGFLQLLLPPLIVAGIRGHGSWWYVPVALLGALAETLTFSRAGVATCVIGVGAALVAARVRDPRTLLAVAAPPIALGVLAVIAVGGRITRFFSFAQAKTPGALGTRSELWSAAWLLYRQHPLLGIGADDYEFELSRAGYPELRTHANSQFIQAAVDGGIPLFAAFVWATLQPILTLWRRAAAHPLVAGMFGALVGLAFHQVLDDMTFFTKVGIELWALTAAGLAIAAVESPA